MIPESQNYKSLLVQPSIPFPIIIALFRVLAAIDLDNYFLCQANKVDDVIPQRLLPTKLEFIKLPHSDPAPK